MSGVEERYLGRGAVPGVGCAASPREGKVPSRCEQGGKSCSWLPSRQEGKEEGSHVLKKLFYLPLFAHYSTGGRKPSPPCVADLTGTRWGWSC